MNSLKTFINKVGDRVRDATPQVNSNIVEGTLPQGNLVEGFVCPTCFEKFDCPEELEKHDEEDHLNPSANYLCPVCPARLSSQKDQELHYLSNHKEKDFSNHSLELLKDELIEVTSTLREERWHSEDLKKEVERLHEAFQKKENNDADVYIHKFQLDAAEEAKTTLSSEVMHLRKQLSEALQHTGILICENQSLEGKLSEISAEKVNLLDNIEGLKTETVSYKRFIEEAQKQVEMLEEKKVVKRELEKRIETFQITLQEKDEKFKQSMEENDNLKMEIDEKTEEVRISLKNVGNLKNECDLVKNNLKARNEEINSLTAKLSAREKILEEFQTNIHPPSDDALKPENAQLLQEYTDKITYLDKQSKTITSKLEEAIKSKLDAELFAKDKTEGFLRLQETLVTLQASVHEKDNQLKKYKHDCIKVNTKLEETMAINDSLTVQKIKKEEEIQQLECSLTQAQVLAGKTSSELMQLKAEYEDMSKSHDLKYSELNEKKNELMTAKNMHENLLAQFDEIVSQLGTKEHEANLLKTENVTLHNECNSQLKQIINYKVDIEKLQLNINGLKNDIAILKKFVNEKESQLLKNNDAITSLNDDLSLSHNEKDKQKESYDCLIENLQLELKCNLHTENELKNEINVKMERLKKSEERNEQLFGEMDKAETEAKKTRDSYDLVVETNTAYHNRIKDNEAKLEELQTYKTQLQIDLSVMNINLAEAEKEKISENSRSAMMDEKVGGLEAELAGLAGDKLELEVRLEAASEERQSLLNRCVSSEKEVERLQQEINLLRRKLEDSTAALHDLGRANQSLQIETNKLAGRKWVEDCEVPSCTKCEKNFTVTNRRHHCRNCGQIFCNECSSKQAAVESNKKAVRVCDSCHVELLAKA